ncbi:MAG: dihydroorotate dehydrogenase B catalytic subunit [Chloroflexi bacterium RBG_13_52_14]|nr:MAG: dihydroorotate dehydrogenase B catalytic subunit [Chloroflexi bacterium RBG_13_52_14]
MKTPNLSVQLAPKNKRGLLLSNPVITASGTFGYGTEYTDVMDIQKLGAIVYKGTTLKPRPGNPQPRLVETACGIINSIGMENIGIEALIKEKAPIWTKWRVPVIVNIVGERIEEYAELAKRLDKVAGVSGIEVNISCPNISAGGLEFGADPRSAAEVTAAVRAKTTLPVIVKLSPNVTDIAEIACAVVEAGADAVSLINTLKAVMIDTQTRKPVLGNISGGLSGPAIKPIALYMVYEVAKAVKVPIIGIGGIATANDALEFIMAGASAVQVGTAIYANPCTPLDIIAGIEHFMQKEGIQRISELVGVAL